MPDYGLSYQDSLTDGRVTTEDVLNLVRERNQACLNSCRSFYSQIEGWYNFYTGTGSGDHPSYRNNVSIPSAFSYIQTGVAHKVQSTFGALPFFSFESATGDDAYADQAAALLHEQLIDARSFAKAIDFYTSAEIYGTGFMLTGWKNVVRPRYIRSRVLGKEQVVSGPHEYFDGPDISVVDILDATPAPGARTAQEAPWVRIRYWVDLDDLLEQATGDNPKWEMAAIKKLMQTPMYTNTMDDWRRRSGLFRSYTDYQARQGDRYSRPVEIVEIRGLVPREFGIKGDRNVVMSVANNSVVLRYETIPAFHSHHGLWSYNPVPDLGSPWGIGKIRIVEKLGAAQNKLLNAQLDALDMFGTPQFLQGAGAYTDQQNLVSKPGRIHKIGGNLSEFQPLVPNLQGLQFISVELEQLSRYMQQGTSATDIVQGLPNANDRTAREYLGLREQAMGRLSVEALLAEKSWIEPMLDQLHQLNIQFLRLPKRLRILGTSGLQDPDTGMPLPLDQSVDIEAMNPDYRARAVGAMQMIGKSVRAQNLMSWAGLMGGNPVWLQLANWVGIAKEIARAMDLPLKSVLNVDKLPLVNQFADQQGKSPQDVMSQVMGAGADNMAALNPQQLGPQTQEPLAAFAQGGY